MSEESDKKYHFVGEVVYLSKSGQAYEPRVYTLDTVENIRELLSDSLYSFSCGDIPRPVFTAAIATANAALKALEVKGASATAYEILQSLAVEQPANTLGLSVMKEPKEPA